ncbi:MAG: glutathione S-transferase [Gammaproteobacteria bacterium]|nr:glutathione S-transferase [Gammaproteobacteria bacterium]
MELICSLSSGYARKVRILAHEFGLMDQLKVTVVAPRESSDYLWPLNPLGKVPTFRVDDMVIYDSQVIAEYLVETYRPEWMLSTGLNRWQSKTRLSMLNGLSDAASTLRKAMNETPPNQTGIALQMGKIERTLRHVEASWDGLETELSLATIALLSAYEWLLVRIPEHDWTTIAPRVEQWYQTFKQRPSVQATPYPAP